MKIQKYYKDNIKIRDKVKHFLLSIFTENHNYYDNLNKSFLEKLKKQYNLFVKVYNDKYVINYRLDDNIVLDDDGNPQPDKLKNNPMVRECRGLIVSKSIKVISRGFDRFFNHGEVDIPEFNWNKYNIYDKVDGSLIKIYHDGNDWQITTRGVAYGESVVYGTGKTYRKSIIDNIFKSHNDYEIFASKLNTDKTYLFEYIAPENKIVIKYSKPELVLLAIRDNKTYKFETNQELKDTFNRFPPNDNISLVKEFANNFSNVKDIIKHINSIEFNEGVVLVDDCFNMIKIKTTDYVNLHYLKGNYLTDKRILKMIYEGSYKEFLSYFPEETDRVNAWFKVITDKNKELQDIYDAIPDELKQDRKSFAFEVNKIEDTIVRSFVMMRFNDKKPIDVLEQAKTLKKFLGVFNDILYPSNFKEEDNDEQNNEHNN